MKSELLKSRDFVAFLVAESFERLAASGMTVLLGFHVYSLTRDPLMLGILGLVEAVPGLSLVLYGGHLADQLDRRRIVLIATAAMAALAGLLATASAAASDSALISVFIVALLLACAKAFRGPAAIGLEAQVLPQDLVLEGVPLIASAGRTADVLGPVVAGFAWAIVGPGWTYAAIGAIVAGTWLIIATCIRKPVWTPVQARESAFRRIAEGIRYVFRSQVLVGSMALDLFAVFFAGVNALLPIFASDILQAGPAGFGVLRSATAAGAMLAALGATRVLPRRNAGRALHGVIACFALCIIVFGLSRNLYLSIAALFCAGVCDGVSMVIRHAIMRLASPQELRGRVAAVRQVFVGSSNELGAFESGLAASLLGTAPAVFAGGVATLVVVGLVAWRAPDLWRLDLERLSSEPTGQGPLPSVVDEVEAEEFPKLASST